MHWWKQRHQILQGGGQRRPKDQVSHGFPQDPKRLKWFPSLCHWERKEDWKGGEGFGGALQHWNNLPPKQVSGLLNASQSLYKIMGWGLELGLVVIWKSVSHWAARVGRKVQERPGRRGKRDTGDTFSLTIIHNKVCAWLWLKWSLLKWLKLAGQHSPRGPPTGSSS